MENELKTALRAVKTALQTRSSSETDGIRAELEALLVGATRRLPESVDIGDGIKMDDTPVTQGMWAEVLDLPPPTDGQNKPVTKVSWYQATAFCNVRSQRDGYAPVYLFTDSSGETLTDHRVACGEVHDDIRVYESQDSDGYRLPTSEEWERAARDGGSPDEELQFYGPASEIAVFSVSEVTDVATKKPTSQGIHDLWGLVWEWTGRTR